MYIRIPLSELRTVSELHTLDLTRKDEAYHILESESGSTLVSHPHTQRKSHTLAHTKRNVVHTQENVTQSCHSHNASDTPREAHPRVMRV